MPSQGNGIGQRCGAGTHHHALERQTALGIGGHHTAALIERERGGLAGRAQHVETIAAVGEKKTSERERARTIGLTCRIHCRGDCSDYAAQPPTRFFILSCGHASILTSIDPSADKRSVFGSRRTH